MKQEEAIERLKEELNLPFLMVRQKKRTILKQIINKSRKS